MSTVTDTSMSTATDVSAGSKVAFRADSSTLNGNNAGVDKVGPRPKVGRTYSRYNHLFAIHAKTRPSPLSRQDLPEATNFNGFRNLMVLMLGSWCSSM